MAQIVTSFEERPQGLVARVVIDNAAKLNVLNSALSAELEAAFRALAGKAGLRAAVLAGAGGRALIGGADIREMAGLNPSTARAFITQLHNVCHAIRALPVPVIARMQGYCLGGGLEIAAACDMRVASDDAVMGMPEVRVGIPSVIEAALLPPLIGWGRTRRILMTGETFDAQKALAWGMVEEVVPVAELDAAIGRLLDDLLAGAPHALALQKRLIGEWEERGIAGAVAAGIDAFAEAWTTPEPGARMRHFLESKRRA